MFLFIQSVTSRKYTQHAGLSYSRSGVQMILTTISVSPGLIPVQGCAHERFVYVYCLTPGTGHPAAVIFTAIVFCRYLYQHGISFLIIPPVFSGTKKRRSKIVIVGYSGKIFHERPGNT